MKRRALPVFVLLVLVAGCGRAPKVDTASVPPASATTAVPPAEPAAGSAVEAEWLTDFEAAKRLSAETGRPILALFTGSDWCRYCMKLEKEVLAREAFKEYAAEHLVLFLADFPRSKPQAPALRRQNRQLASAYGVKGFPTVLLLDKDGKKPADVGYRSGGAEVYVERLKLARESR
jgi:protein disulfide-isomerase